MATTDDVPMNPTYMDYREHERTYRVFTWATKWVTLVVAIVILLLAFFLVW